MNKYAMQAILKRLIEIKNRVNIDKNKGICFNLYNYTYNRKKFKSTFIGDCSWLEDQFEVWPKCHVYEDGSKDLNYPVGGVEEYKIEQAQGTVLKNPKRLRLVDYLIKQAKTQLYELKA